MAKLSVEEVLKLARLAKIQLSDQEAIEFTNELVKILDYIEQLSAVDVSELAPTIQVTGLANVTRADQLINYEATPEELLKNTPAIQDRQIKVKRVMD